MSAFSSIQVSVTNPTLCNEKFGGKYISYKINSDTDRSDYRQGVVTVDRRFSDFVWLHNELENEFPGCILPALPEKQAVGRFSTEFIDSRRRALERYIVKVANHPMLSGSKAVRLVLQADDSELAKAKDETKAAKPKATEVAKSWFEGAVVTISTSRPELEKSAADIKIEEMTQYVANLDRTLCSTWKFANTLAHRTKEVSQAVFEFGQAVSFLGQSEGDALGNALTQFGTAVDSLSTINAAHSEDELVKFVEPLDDYTRLMSSIRSCISTRNDKKNAYIQSMMDLEVKQNAHRKVMGVPGKEGQAKQKEDAVQSAEEACAKAKQEFEKVTDRLLSEFEFFKSQKAHDLKNMISDFVAIQMEHNQKAEKVWADLLPRLQAIQLEGYVMPPNPETTSTASEPVPTPFRYEDFPAPGGASGYGTGPRSDFREETDEDFAGV